jgi:hypothetical protein
MSTKIYLARDGKSLGPFTEKHIMRTFLISSFALLANIALVSSSRSAPFETLADARIRHVMSGFVFPMQVGVFQRGQTHEYNQAGSDVSVGYNTVPVPIVATVYVYPAPNQDSADVLTSEYAAKRAEVLHMHQTAAILSESPAAIFQAAKKYVGKQGYFSYRDVFAGTPQNLKSQLLVFRDGPFFIEYRFTYARDQAEQAEKEIEHFIRGWSWR